MARSRNGNGPPDEPRAGPPEPAESPMAARPQPAATPAPAAAPMPMAGPVGRTFGPEHWDWRDTINGSIGPIHPSVAWGGGASPVHREGPFHHGEPAVFVGDNVVRSEP